MTSSADTGGFLPQTNPPPSTRKVKNAAPSGQAPATQPFGPGNNLIGTQINPTQSARGANAAGMTDRAAQGVAGFQFSPFSPMGQANTSQSQGIYDNLLKQSQGGGGGNYGGGSYGMGGGAQLNSQLQPFLDKVTNSPDRGQLANDMYGVLEQRAQPGFEQRLRSVGQKAGALGRVGLGLTTSELGDVETIHNRDLDLSRRQLAAEGAGQTLDDRLKQLGAARDVYGSVASINSGAALAGQQANERNWNNQLTLARDLYGRESDSYSRGVGERDSGLDYEQTRFGNQRNQLGDLSIYEQDIYGRDRNDRDETRGERDYQYGAERDAQGDQERQWGMEETSRGNAFDRGVRGFGAGYGTNPAGAVGARGTRQNEQAQGTLDTLGPMYLEWARQRQQRGMPVPQGNNPPPEMGY